MRKIKTLRAKLSIAFALVALLGVGTVALVINQATTRAFDLYVSRGAMMRAEQVAADAALYYEQTGSWQGIENKLQTSAAEYQPGMGMGRRQGMRGMAGMSNSRILIVGTDETVIVDTGKELVGQAIKKDDLAKSIPISVKGQVIGTLLITTQDMSGHSDLEKQFLSAVNQAVLWAVGAVTAAALVAAVLLSRQLVGPLRQLTAASEAMAQGDLSQRVAIRSNDEVGELGRAFNQMANDLQAAETQRQQMTADIAHELRNPLSVIRGNLEALLDGIYPTDAEHLGPIYEETILLQRLVEDLRLLSLTDTGQLHLVYTDVDFNTLLNTITDSTQAIADDKGIALQVNIPSEPIIIHADADRLRQVIGNLVGNALRYTPTGGTVMLRAARDSGFIRVSVSDTGPGIALADLPHVFDRFYRGDAARDRASGGSGLGLPIARALARAHGGDIHVESTPGQGARFTVSLPEA